MDTLLTLDHRLLYAVNNDWRNPVYDQLMPWLSNSLWFWLSVVVVGLLYFCLSKRERKLQAVATAIILCALSSGTSNLLADTVKKTANRPRPYQALPGIFYQEKGLWQQTLTDFEPATGGSSFYSGHATNSAALATTLSCLAPQASGFFVALAFGVGYSRVYLGKHYPSDVLIGWATGVAVGLFWFWLFSSRGHWGRRAKALYKSLSNRP